MKLSAKVEYGVRAMAVLAYNYNKGPLPLREIAAQESISMKFLEQIFSRLRNTGLVTSLRGSRGGYMLSRKPSAIRIGDIVRAVEGPIVPVGCLSDTGSNAGCHRKSSCLTRQVWEKLRDKINDVLDGVCLEELVELRTADKIIKGDG